MADLFHIIEGAVIILRRGGVFRQVAVYVKGENLYARWGAGFIQIRGNSGTTLPDCLWEELELPESVGRVVEGRFGTPMLKAPEPKQITQREDLDI